jgi:5'-deoxynucleotidase YfbR-like HD superfamily hydrolase
MIESPQSNYTMSKPKFDVFLSHNSKNKDAAIQLKKLLEIENLKAWIDVDELLPGLPWQPGLSAGIKASKSIAVLVGAEGMGSWQSEEVSYALTLAAKDRRPVIGVLLPGAPALNEAEVPWGVQSRTIVDMRDGIDGKGLQALIWGITKRKQDDAPRTADTKSGGDLIGTKPAHLDSRLYHLFQKGGSIVLDEYFSLLRLFMADAPWQTLDSFIEYLSSLIQGVGSIACVNGYPGTGKSCLLGCLYLRQQERFMADKTGYFPVMINLRNYVDDHSDMSRTAEESSKLLISEADLLCAKAGTSNLMLIVDGCEDYYRHPWQTTIASALRSFIEKLATRAKTLKIVGYGRPDPTYPTDRLLDAFHWAERDDIVQFQRLPAEHENMHSILELYSNLNAHDKQPLSPNTLASQLQDHRVTEVDLFILSLLEQAIRKKWNNGGAGIAYLYRNYCRHHIRGPLGELLSGAQIEGAMKYLAREVFDFYVSEPLRLEAKGEAASSLAVNSGMHLFGLPHLHASVKEYLIAEHIVELISSESADDSHRERYIYPYGINRFVRAIINLSVDVQRRVIATIEKHYPNSIVRDRIHLAYLLGRFEGDTIKRQARRLVVNYLAKHKSEYPHHETSAGSEQDLAARQQLLLERTLSISAIYLEDEKSALDYLKDLLNDPLSDNLNRGFHLEYYEDAPRLPESGILVAKDDVKFAPVKTFEVLYRKLSTDLSTKKCRAMTAVELQTLCSLCLARHVKGCLAPHKRERLLGLLMDFRNRDGIRLPSEIMPYLEMAQYVLVRENNSVGSIFAELHALKAQKRAGWNCTHSVGSKDYLRACDSPESVSEHIFGCVLLAEALLPESASFPGYSKSEVIRMLIIHDVMETFTGDKPFFLKNKEDEFVENSLMKRTIALSTVPGFQGIIGWSQLWDKWKGCNGVNASIAHDIDKIESYVQLMQYLRRKEPECVIEDAYLWASDVAERLDSELGKQIFASLRHDKADLLEWFKNREDVS